MKLLVFEKVVYGNIYYNNFLLFVNTYYKLAVYVTLDSYGMKIEFYYMY